MKTFIKNFIKVYFSGIFMSLLNIAAGIQCISEKLQEGSIFFFAGVGLLVFMLYDNKS